MASKKAVAKIDEHKNTHKSTEVTSFDETPDYLSEQKGRTGLEAFGQGDFKIPRLKIIQPLSPEVRSFQGKAIPGQFWHTGLNIDLGSELNMVVCLANKRVILWNPREEGGGILALSRNAVNWDYGGNKEFTVKLKNVKNPVTWQTGKNVPTSGLLEWGTYNPEDEESGPAASLIYEYLVYISDRPEISPIVLSCFRTALQNARQFNTSLLTLKKPIQSILVKCVAQEKGEGDNIWWVPNFELLGYAPKEIYQVAKEYGDKYGNYVTEYDQEEGNNIAPVDTTEKAAY